MMVSRLPEGAGNMLTPWVALGAVGSSPSDLAVDGVEGEAEPAEDGEGNTEGTETPPAHVNLDIMKLAMGSFADMDL
eukprot:940198-Prorocentrum_minimum.AAC.1